tara:strand:- start:32745 stop:33020 length:276 start_codon:yes stop_codon:yes gene_type:complete
MPLFVFYKTLLNSMHYINFLISGGNNYGRAARIAGRGRIFSGVCLESFVNILSGVGRSRSTALRGMQLRVRLHARAREPVIERLQQGPNER